MIRLRVADPEPIGLEVKMTAASSGPAPVLIDKVITENGVYAASQDGANGYRQVTAIVPNSYSAADEGKVVANGALVSQTARAITANGTYDTTLNNSVTANVPNSYSAADEGKVVEGGALVSQTAKTITANGTYDTTKNNSVTAEVPNTYTAADEGKVVDEGALVNQTARTITSNGTYDTTKNNSVTANVPNTYTAADEGKVVDGGALVSQTARTITSNGTYDTTKNNSVTANVPNTYTAADEGKVVDEGALVSQTSLSVTENRTYDTTLNNEVVVNVSGGGGIDLDWLAAATPTPSVRNLFYKLANGTAEHGEFTTESTITNTLTTFFTMTNFSDINPPQGILIIDKDFYQGQTVTPNSTESLSFLWLDKSFINPASVAADGLKYVGIRAMRNSAGTAIGNNIAVAFVIFDNNTAAFRAKWKLDGHNFQLRHDYNNNQQYTLLFPNRTYIWIAY